MTGPLRPLATSAEVAAYLAVTPAALRIWRSRGTGPDFIRAGKQRVRYDWADVQAWVQANRTTPTERRAP